MTASHLPIGTSVILACSRRGCRYAKHTVRVTAAAACRREHKCLRGPSGQLRTVDLMSALKGWRFPVGATLTVSLVKTGFIGKIYTFTIQADRPPTSSATCLAPGSRLPGVGC